MIRPDDGPKPKPAMPDSIYLEFIARGNYIKVVAIEAATGLEAAIVGAAGTPRAELERLAIRKLDLVRRRNARTSQRSGPGTFA
jgi:Domain of unknown function (DUF6898)